MFYFRVLFLCCMELSLHVLCSCCMLVVNNNLKQKETKYVLYFSAHGLHFGILCYIFFARGTRSVIIVLYFLHVERALALLYCIFCVWNALWRYCNIYFPYVRCAMALLCYIFRMWNALRRYCVLLFACGTRSGVILVKVSACGMRSGVIVL